MAPLKDSFISFASYNRLPHIQDVSAAPEIYASDLADLRALLIKHKVPEGVCVRLIHKHYEVEDGEVMGFQEVAVPACGKVTVMHPMKNPEPTKLHGIHYYVDADGQFQAYEYTLANVPDMNSFGPFLDEFSRIVVERGLQMKFGLKFQCEEEKKGWTEFEFPHKRSTIMIPEGLPMPEGEYDFEVVTEWGADPTSERKGCSHCWHQVRTCSHKSMGKTGEAEVFLGAQKIEAGMPVWNIVNAVAAIC